MHHIGLEPEFAGMAPDVRGRWLEASESSILGLKLNSELSIDRFAFPTTSTKETNMYPEEMIAPMRQELVQLGFQEWRRAEDVDRDLSAAKGISLVVINSVCGCSAASCRPGVALALQDGPKPDRAFTVFAGNDVEATAQVREHLLGEPPSSPSIGIFKDGKMHGMLHRKDIQGRHPAEIADLLKGALASALAS